MIKTRKTKQNKKQTQSKFVLKLELRAWVDNLSEHCLDRGADVTVTTQFFSCCSDKFTCISICFHCSWASYTITPVNR